MSLHNILSLTHRHTLSIEIPYKPKNLNQQKWDTKPIWERKSTKSKEKPKSTPKKKVIEGATLREDEEQLQS